MNGEIASRLTMEQDGQHVIVGKANGELHRVALTSGETIHANSATQPSTHFWRQRLPIDLDSQKQVLRTATPRDKHEPLVAVQAVAIASNQSLWAYCCLDELEVVAGSIHNAHAPVLFQTSAKPSDHFYMLHSPDSSKLALDRRGCSHQLHRLVRLRSVPFSDKKLKGPVGRWPGRHRAIDWPSAANCPCWS